MPIDIEILRQAVERIKQGQGFALPFGYPQQLLAEIEQLRAENLKLFAALKNLHSYAANGDVFTPCLDDHEDHEWSTADSSAQCIHCGQHIDPELD